MEEFCEGAKHRRDTEDNLLLVGFSIRNTNRLTERVCPEELLQVYADVRQA